MEVVWKTTPQKVTVLYTEWNHTELSRAEPEKFCLNIAAPSAKAKYS